MMNNKILIPLLLTVSSGCSVIPSTEVTQVASGGGSAGLAHNKKLPAFNTATTKTNVRPKVNASAQSLSEKVPFESIDNDASDEQSVASLKTSNPDTVMAEEYEKTTGLGEKKQSLADEELVLDNIDEDEDGSYSVSGKPLRAKRGETEMGSSRKKSTVVYEYQYPAYNGQQPNGKPLLKLPKPTSAGNPSKYRVAGANYKVLPFSNGFVERGIASWYGADFHGEKTSNGETYDMFGMTAAHKRLPIPSYVKVTNLKNKRSVVLRINDRGPFHDNRVIDLSYAAAQKLDMHQPGVEEVKIEAIPTPRKEKVYLQLGVFNNPVYAQLLQKKIVENKMPEPMVQEIKVGGKIAYRVQLGPVFSLDKVNEFNAKLAKMGISETWYVTENKIN